MPGAEDDQHPGVGRVYEVHHIAVDSGIASEPIGEQIGAGPVPRLAEMTTDWSVWADAYGRPQGGCGGAPERPTGAEAAITACVSSIRA